jgi:hypothetical protein
MADTELLPRFDFEGCDKNSLEEYANSLNLKLDMAKPLKTLIEQVKKVEKSLFGTPDKTDIAERPLQPKPEYQWLKHKTNGRVFNYTPALHEHGLLPCDEDGNLLADLNDGNFTRIS